MVNPSISIITMISSLIILGMIIISSIIYYGERDRRQILAIEYWMANGCYFVFSYLTTDSPPKIAVLATLFWIWRFTSINKILESVGRVSLMKRWHISVIIASYLLSLVLAALDFDFIYYSLPQSLSIFIAGMHIMYLARMAVLKRKNIGVVHYMLFTTIFFIFLHLLDYPFLRFDMTMAPVGYAIILITNILMAILLPSVTIYDLKNDERYLLEAQLLSQSKFSALGEMTAGIAHEINNPLGIVASRANYLKKHVLRDTADKDFIISNLEKIEATSERMGKIITSIRKFSRDNRKEPFEPMDLNLLFEETLSYCLERFRMGSVKLTVETCPDCKLECRPTQLSQVFINLLNNSFDAVVGKENPWVHVKYEVGETLKIFIQDSGTGIPEEIRSKMMEPFYTTKELAGTGLGLSISKGIIEDHHGRFYYDETSMNTTFVVELPFKQTHSV